MAYAWRITDGGLGMVTEYGGDLTGAELLRAQDERAAAIRASGAVRYLVNDYSATRSLDVAMETILEHARAAGGKVPEVGTGLLIAFVVPPGLAHGLARVWSAHVAESGWRIELFRARDEAEAWIRRESGLALAFV